MTDFHTLQNLISSAKASKSNVEIRELGDDDEDGEESEQHGQTETEASPDSKTHFRREKPEEDKSLKSQSRDDSSTVDEDDDHEEGDDQHHFIMDVEEAKLEQLGTLLSAFFQDDRGYNVVDAIIQNSKVQNKIAKTLERICDRLDRTK